MKFIHISYYYWLTLATFSISLSSTYCCNYTLHLNNAINMGILTEAKKFTLDCTDLIITGYYNLRFKKQVSGGFLPWYFDAWLSTFYPYLPEYLHVLDFSGNINLIVSTTKGLPTGGI